MTMSAHPSDKKNLQQEHNKLHVMLLSSVSHDLKTPLACVIGSLEIHQHLKDVLSAEHKDTLIATAIEEARRLDSFITNILDMSALENGVHLKRESVDMGQLVRQCVLQMEPRLRHHEMQLELSSGMMTEVSVSWISRAVTLLLNNAAQYTPAKTKIVVTITGDKTLCRITVRDHGPGISKKLRTGIFHKHTRATRQDSKTAGTGLGLPICKAIAEAHGGTIRMHTPSGGGVAFTLTLPKL